MNNNYKILATNSTDSDDRSIVEKARMLFEEAVAQAQQTLSSVSLSEPRSTAVGGRIAPEPDLPGWLPWFVNKVFPDIVSMLICRGTVNQLRIHIEEQMVRGYWPSIKDIKPIVQFNEEASIPDWNVYNISLSEQYLLLFGGEKEIQSFLSDMTRAVFKGISKEERPFDYAYISPGKYQMKFHASRDFTDEQCKKRTQFLKGAIEGFTAVNEKNSKRTESLLRYSYFIIRDSCFVISPAGKSAVDHRQLKGSFCRVPESECSYRGIATSVNTETIRSFFRHFKDAETTEELLVQATQIVSESWMQSIIKEKLDANPEAAKVLCKQLERLGLFKHSRILNYNFKEAEDGIYCFDVVLVPTQFSESGRNKLKAKIDDLKGKEFVYYEEDADGSVKWVGLSIKIAKEKPVEARVVVEDAVDVVPGARKKVKKKTRPAAKSDGFGFWGLVERFVPFWGGRQPDDASSESDDDKAPRRKCESSKKLARGTVRGHRSDPRDSISDIGSEEITQLVTEMSCIRELIDNPDRSEIDHFALYGIALEVMRLLFVAREQLSATSSLMTHTQAANIRNALFHPAQPGYQVYFSQVDQLIRLLKYVDVKIMPEIAPGASPYASEVLSETPLNFPRKTMNPVQKKAAFDQAKGVITTIKAIPPGERTPNHYRVLSAAIVVMYDCCKGLKGKQYASIAGKLRVIRNGIGHGLKDEKGKRILAKSPTPENYNDLLTQWRIS